MSLSRALWLLPDSPERLTTLGGADLEALATTSVKHGLGGVLLDALGRAEVHLPAQLERQLRHDVMTTVAAATRVKRLFVSANTALRARGIRPVLLKGIGLGARFYGSAFARPTSDVDLLVASHEVPAARAVLAALGLSPKQESDDYYPPAYRHHEAFEGELGLVELHYRLMANWGATWEADAVLARAIDARLEGVEVRYLCPEDELVYLALHAANHMLSRLGWLYDLKLAIRANPTLDWGLVLRTARESRLPAPAFYAFDAANRLTDAQVPSWVLAALSPGKVAVAAARQLFSGSMLESSRLEHHKWLWAAAKVVLADRPSKVLLFAARRLAWNAGGARHFV